MNGCEAGSRARARTRRSTSLTIGLVCALLLVTACSPRPETLAPLAPDAVILAFGDSLTAGTGAAPEASYPSRLEALSGRRVINAGNPGERSRGGVERLPGLLEEHRPDLLILTHGGNDLLRRVDTEETRENIETMIGLARDRGIDVLLVAVPAPTLLRLRSDPMYADIGQRLQVPVEDGALAHVLSRDAMKADPIHPNGDGYRYVAERVHRLLVETGAL
ncbi:MAG: arylesterase [Thioalkalivibrio sp.]|nr:MAG: arylesterase [Thioalkalivibrio sp.]